jgi:hypothetical protein
MVTRYVIRAKNIDGLYVVQGWLAHDKAKLLMTKCNLAAINDFSTGDTPPGLLPL